MSETILKLRADKVVCTNQHVTITIGENYLPHMINELTDKLCRVAAIDDPKQRHAIQALFLQDDYGPLYPALKIAAASDFSPQFGKTKSTHDALGLMLDLIGFRAALKQFDPHLSAEERAAVHLALRIHAAQTPLTL